MQEILKRLDSIGAKLGEGVAFSWEVFMRQALWVDGVFSVIGYVVLMFLAVRCFAWAKAACKRAQGSDDDNLLDFLGPIGAAVGGAILSVSSVYGIWDGVAHVLNPQYYALMDLVKLVGK